MNAYIRKIYLTFFCIVLLLFVSCAEDNVSLLTETPINVSASSDYSKTRTGADIQTATFVEGETINAYYKITGGGDIGKTPTILTASAAVEGKNKLIPDIQPYYPQKGTVDIKAFYPPSKVNVNTTSFTVEQNQTASDDYMRSDLMWAGISSQGNTVDDVNLTFDHEMAKIAVTITGTEGVLIQEVRLVNTLRTIEITPSSLTLGEPVEESDEANKIILLAVTNEEYTVGIEGGSEQLQGVALFPPQTINNQFIEVVTNHGTTFFSVNMAFASATQYTANLTVSRQQIGLTASITDWNSSVGVVTVQDLGSGFVIDGYIAPYTYSLDSDGNPISWEPQIESGKLEVKWNKEPLAPEMYEIKYYSNAMAGTALMVAQGKGVYEKYTAVKTFTIQPAPFNMRFDKSTIIEDYVINGTVDNVLLNIGDGNMLFSSSDESVATVSADGVVTMRGDGVAKIKVQMDDKGNYEPGSAEYELTVNKRDASKFTVEFKKEPDLTYNGTKRYPNAADILVYDTDAQNNKILLENNNNYTLTYSNNINAGTDALITIIGIGKYHLTKTKNYTIKQGQAKITMPTGEHIIGIDGTYDCQATATFGEILYSSAEPAMAEVSTKGIVTGKSVSTNYVNITASVSDDPAGNYRGTSEVVKVKVEQMYYEFGSEKVGEEFTWLAASSKTAVYTIEVVGGAGGNADGGLGGKGGLVRATITLNAGTSVKIAVGGGANGSTGGWNGGGSSTVGAGGGGGRTYVSIGGNVLIAGGGGGATDGTKYGRDGGTSDAGGTDTTSGANSSDGGAGGGGYSGGYAGTVFGGGYGGSNYIGGSSWSNILNIVSKNGPTSGNDNNVYNGWVKISYEYE